jgi:hypothetical protein
MLPTPHTVVESAAYLSKAVRLMDEDERSEVVTMLAENPKVGKVIKGTGGLRKVRIALGGRGKRGGGRVIYWFHSEDYPAVLLWVFAKNEADDLTPAQRDMLVRTAQELLDEFRRPA